MELHDDIKHVLNESIAFALTCEDPKILCMVRDERIGVETFFAYNEMNSETMELLQARLATEVAFMNLDIAAEDGRFDHATQDET